MRARAADADGASVVAAANYAAALAAEPDSERVAIRAYRQGLASGDLALARRAGAVLRRAGVAPADQSILAFSDAVAARDWKGAHAVALSLAETPLDFMVPVLEAWLAVEDRGVDPIALLDREQEDTLGRRYAAENRALILLATGRNAEGLAAVRTLLGAGRPALDLRLNAAALLARRGKRGDARQLLAGEDMVLSAYAARLGRGERGTARFGLSRFFARLADDLSADGTEPLSIVLTRSALLLDPNYDRARLALADALARQGSLALAQDTLRRIPADSIFARQAMAVDVLILGRADREEEALSVARTLAADPRATSADARRLADLLLDLGRYDESAAAYATAIDRDGGGPEWVLYLQRGGALDEAGRWNEALPDLRRAAELAPDEPVVLNQLGYTQVERGHDLPGALRMLEKAHRLQPDDHNITDSLGWAYLRTGNAGRALPLLEEAAASPGASGVIFEHLGDALWGTGRRFEARYAWAAAALQAEDDAMTTRIAQKLRSGAALPKP